MKKTLIIVLAVMIALPLIVTGTIVIAAGPEGAITIDNDAATFKGAKKKKTAVSFQHSTHPDTACLDCHHKAEQAKLDAGEATACNADGCHGPTEEVVDGKKKLDLEDAYHGKCKDCHKANKDKGASTKCTACHPK